jgi:hypothetical protein
MNPTSGNWGGVMGFNPEEKKSRGRASHIMPVAYLTSSAVAPFGRDIVIKLQVRQSMGKIDRRWNCSI